MKLAQVGRCKDMGKYDIWVQFEMEFKEMMKMGICWKIGRD